MATPQSPSSSSKRTFPSFSVRRPSASNSTTNLPSRSVSAASTSTLNLSRPSFSTASNTAAVAASPTSPPHAGTQTAGSGIPASLRSLRNLFPFGGSGKPPHNSSSNGNVQTNTPGRTFSVGLGSVRRSMNVAREREKEKDRNRKFSLSNEALMTPVLSIERNHSQASTWTLSSQGQNSVVGGGEETPPLRRSVSLSRLEGAINFDKPLPALVDSSSSFAEEVEAGMTLMTLRTPSPPPSPDHFPPLPSSMPHTQRHTSTTIAELSTIIEADNSGISISKHIPLSSPSSSSHSLSPPSSPRANDEENTIRRPIFLQAPSHSHSQRPNTPLMTSSPLEPSTPAHQHHHSITSTSTASGTTPTAAPAITSTSPNDEETLEEGELSTSQLVSQVQDALARASTSWGGSSDRAFVIDADASFIHMHDDESSGGVCPTPPESSCASSFVDDEEPADVDVSLVAVLDAPLDSSSPSPQDEVQEVDDDDDASRMNNSIPSITHPDDSHILAPEDATLDLGSLDPDLRDAVSRGVYSTRQQQTSPGSDSGGKPVGSGRTVVLSSPPVPRFHTRAQQQQSESKGVENAPRSVSSPTSTATTATPSSVPKPSLQPLSLSSTLKQQATASKRRIVSSSFLPRLRSSPPRSPRSPHAHSFSVSAPVSTKNSSSPTKVSFEGSRIPQSPRTAVFSPASVAPPGATTSAVAGGGASSRVTTSTPVKPKKPFGSIGVAGGVQQRQEQHRRKSSVPVATWRNSRELSGLRVGGQGGAPEVRVVEVGSEIDPHVVPGPSNLPGRTEEEAHTWPVTRRDRTGTGHDDDGEEDTGVLSVGGGQRWENSRRDESPVLGYSVIRATGSGEMRLGSPFLQTDRDGQRIQSPSPLPPSPSLIIPSTSRPLSRGGSLRGIRDKDYNLDTEDAAGEGEESLFDGTTSISGRPSRRVPAPLRLFLGSSGSTNGSASTGVVDVPERQPSPLRSVLRVEKEEQEEGYLGGEGRGRSGARLSVDTTRPSMESRASPDPQYQKYVVAADRDGPSQPPTRAPARDRERDGLVARVRKRSMSVQENSDYPPRAAGPATPAPSIAGGSMVNLSTVKQSARERLARARYYGDLGSSAGAGGATRPWSSMSMRSSSRMEPPLYGSRNNAPTRLSLYERERERDRERDRSPVGMMERSISDRATERERERSGSVSAISAMGIGTLGRYASLRSASEYNFTQHHGHARRESVAGLMESPTFTVSTSVSGSGSASGSKADTPRSTSASTGITSISASTSTSNTNKDRDREELRDLKEKHASETGALLGALSDSQRTCRVLREENVELRERLGEVERENERLSRVVGELEREVLSVVREREREREREKERVWERRERLSSSVVSWRGQQQPFVTPLAKQRDLGRMAGRTPAASASGMGKWGVFERDLEDVTMMRQSQIQSQRSKLDNVLFSREMETRELELEPRLERERSHDDDEEEDGLVTPVREHPVYDDDDDPIAAGDEESLVSTLPPPSSNNVNTSSAHLRRPSTSSSIFPIPPSNMTMLLHDEMGLLSELGVNSNPSSASLGNNKLPGSPAIPISSRRNGKLLSSMMTNNNNNSNAASNASVSPTTENFSMMTGSPGSLFLKPEHEMMLDEMESFDLGRGSGSVSGVVSGGEDESCA